MIGKIYVPDEGPLDAKILFVGESPGESEEQQKQPFVGQSGQLLMECLGRAGVSRENVRLSNLCHYRPSGNKYESLIGTKELKLGMDELRQHIIKHKPNLIVPLGAMPLKFFTEHNTITQWRGSILETFMGIKLIATYHPSAVLRDRTLLPIFQADIYRITSDGQYPERRLPERRFIIDPRGLDLEEVVQQLESSREFSVDIESTRKGDVGTKHIICIGFSSTPSEGICIVNRQDAASHNAFERILSSPAKKVMHFGTFDSTALEMNGYNTNNFTWDTLAAQHILNAEMPRGLDFLTSIYTREPYYKSAGRSEIPGDTKEWGSKIDRESLYVYNCRDACVTLEIKQEQDKELNGRDRELFEFEMSLITVALSLGRNGMPIDVERRASFEKGLFHRWMKLQQLMNMIVGKEVNVRSPKLKDILYGDLKLPVRRNRDAGITTDEDAIVSLIGYTVGHLDNLKSELSRIEWNKKLLILKSILEIRGLRQLLSTFIKAELSHDERYRSIYKYSNTETGRGACEKYIDGSGVNAQTMPRSSIDVPDNLADVPMFDLSDLADDEQKDE